MRHPLSSRKSSVYIKLDVNFSHELPLTFTFLSYSEETEGKKEVKEGGREGEIMMMTIEVIFLHKGIYSVV